MSPAIWLWALTYGIPYTIAYLVHYENTRPLRIALFPVGLAFLVRFITTINIADEPLFALPFVETALKWSITASSYYAFMPHPPRYPSVPVEPFWAGLRRTTPARALNLLVDANQRLSLQPITRPHVPYLRAVGRRFGSAALHGLIVELLTFPPYYLIDPSHRYVGIGTWLGRAYWTLTVGLTMYQGTAMVCELFAGLTIALGLYTEEEWPEKWWNNPLASTSLTEFWGKRYHPFMRDIYIRLATPLEYYSAPRAIHILGIFGLSGLYHTVFFYPMTGSLRWYPHMTFWLGCGLGCVLERAYYKLTGKKVDGWWGRVWVLAWLLLISGPMIRGELEYGWPARTTQMARASGGEDRMLPLSLHGLGLPGPIAWSRAQREGDGM